MFALHERTRRTICRAAFLAGCVVPALGVLVWSNSLTGTTQRRASENLLSHASGLRATAQSVAFPRPGITLYEGIELADSETGAPLVRSRFLEVGGNSSVTACVASQPEIDALRLADFWQLVQPTLRHADGAGRLIRISAGEVTLHWHAGAQTLTDCLGQLELPGATDAPRIAQLTFRLSGAEAAQPVRLKIVRSLQDGEPVTTAEFHTAGAALPVDLLASALGITNQMGARARFNGSLRWSESAAGVEGELAGTFSDVDLQRLVTEQFPHRLSGMATITVHRARFARGRLEEAAGAISAGPGVVSRSLINSSAANLRLVRGPVPEAGGSLCPYEELAIGFLIDTSGISLRGQCSGSPGVILQSHDGVLLSEAPGPSGPVVALLRMLVPDSQVQVPATRESSWLATRLPVPQVMPPADQPPVGKLRLKSYDAVDQSRAPE